MKNEKAQLEYIEYVGPEDWGVVTDDVEILIAVGELELKRRELNELIEAFNNK